MPIPFILGGVAAAAGAAGVGTGIRGALKMKDAKNTMEVAEYCHKINIEKFEKQSKETNMVMDELGELELNILKGFNDFSDVIEKIQNRPEFKQYDKDGVTLPKYDKEELKEVSVGAGVILGGLGGAAIGSAGGVAAAGAATTAIMAFGTASTGTAIASLSGAAATNATLAVLGGGTLAMGGGGVALGTTILSATTLGIGLLVGGVIFNFTGSNLSDKADEAYAQMQEAGKTIESVCNYLQALKATGIRYEKSIRVVREKYLESFNYIHYVVNKMHKVDWNHFTEEERLATENTVLLVGLLYKMCQVNIVIKAENDKDINQINHKVINDTIKESTEILKNIA